MTTSHLPRASGLTLALLTGMTASLPAASLTLQGQVDLRAVLTSADQSWTRQGLGKLRYDRHNDGLRLGQAFLKAETDLGDTVTAHLLLSAADDRRGVLDVNEAWLAWNPLPTGAWRMRWKAGAFFAATNLEIDYDSIGWTPLNTVSSSAVNSWMGEELRTKGVEVTVTHKGAHVGSPHDYGATLGVFKANDPAGSLLAWRGWSISDRITGLTERLRLADLPVYRPDGPLKQQSRELHVFREIDGRPGYYAAAQYGQGDWLALTAMHADNRADPLIVKNGQYSWHTRFDHLGLRLRPAGQWELTAQALRGETIMGPDAVRLRFKAWYLLASHPLAGGRLSARYDRFSTTERDILPADPNGERGSAVALAFALPLKPGLSLVTELLRVQSRREARQLFGQDPALAERSLTAALRWQF